MRLAFLGTPEAAVPSLEALVAAGHEIAIVITRGDRRRGRGPGTTPSPIKAAAVDLGLRVEHTLSSVTTVDAEAGVVVAYGALIPSGILDELTMLNVHFSLLPRWRGAAPVERAILAGDHETGVCIMGLEATLDTGPIYACARTPVDAKDASTLTAELAELGAHLIVDVLASSPWPTPVAQEGEATYAAKLVAADFKLHRDSPAEELERVVRAGRASCQIEERHVIVERAHVAGEQLPVGTVGVIEGAPALGTRRGSLVLDVVRPAGSRSMSARSWWAGAHLAPGAPWA